MESSLVVFGADQIDTSRAEMLVQCLNDKIKEKRYKLQKIIISNEEKKKRNESMKNERIQLTAKLTHLEQENSVREQQLQSEQTRIKELQLNIQMLNDHNNSIKRDAANEERKYDQEKSLLTQKFERTKQQWTDVFKPQYEQSRVYQYLKQSDTVYTSLAERKEALVNAQKAAYRDYWTRRGQAWNENNLHGSIVSLAKWFLSRRDQVAKIEGMKKKCIELEQKQQTLIANKVDKMKAWESVYTQPVKRDLMDFCLQTNMDQALTLSFNQIQQDMWSQPSTPTTGPASTPVNEQVDFPGSEQMTHKSAVTFQLPTEPAYPRVIPTPLPGTTASSITIIPGTAKATAMHQEQQDSSNRLTAPSVLHLTTAITDDDDELFSASHRKLPTSQMEKMTINDNAPSTQAFVVESNVDIDREVTSLSRNEHSNSAFTIPPPPARDPPAPASNPSTETTANKSNLNVSFQLAPPRLPPSRPGASNASLIHPQVTSTDVQEMLLTFSPGPSALPEDAPQPMEEENTQQEQQRPEFSMVSSIESTTSVDEEYTGFNYNFGFAGATPNDGSDRGFTSPINFGNWPGMGSPVSGNANDQFSAFLQQTNGSDSGVSSSFAFPSFTYGDLSNGEVSTDEAFGSFFFGTGGTPNNREGATEDK